MCSFVYRIFDKTVCSQVPVPSASLSELDPLLSEEPPFFLEEAMDSTGFSAAEQQQHIHYQTTYNDHSHKLTFLVHNRMKWCNKRVTSSP